MDIDKLKTILDLVREYDLTEVELEQEGLRLKIRKDATGALSAFPPAVSPPPSAPAAVGPSSPAAMATAPAQDTDDEVELAVVKSPIVGTFYRSSEPGTAPFVEVGSAVKKGQVLCIIEAMKLMNEIDSEYEGEITSIYVENGQPVQYGERLFAIRTK